MSKEKITAIDKAICELCGKAKNDVKNIADYQVCEECAESLENKTGHCSMHCQISGHCDGSC